MKKFIGQCIIALCSFTLANNQIDAQNPILPGFHADPEILHSAKDGKYYIYSTTDGFENWDGYTFHVFSSKNLKKWQDEGVVLDVKSDQVKWAQGNAWAPAIEEVKQADGSYKYYLYFSAASALEDDPNTKMIGVAIADSPTGPFTDIGHPLVSKKPLGIRHGQQIDVDIFTDPQTGKHYLYWGNGYMAGAELNDDMISFKQTVPNLLTPMVGSNYGTNNDFKYREGTYVFYRNGKYYFLWSVDDTGSPNYHVAYGTSDNPLGPIQVNDDPVVLEQNPTKFIFGTGHNSILQVRGTDKWFIVYHRINEDHIQPQDGPGIHREVCIDKLKFDKEGNIIQVKPTK